MILAFDRLREYFDIELSKGGARESAYSRAYNRFLDEHGFEAMSPDYNAFRKRLERINKKAGEPPPAKSQTEKLKN